MVSSRPLSITFDMPSLLGDVPEDRNTEKDGCIVKREYLRTSRPISLISVPGKVMEQIVLETIPKHMKNSQHGFVKWKSCLTNLKASYNKMMALVDEERAVDVVFSEFCCDFSTVCWQHDF